MKALVRFCEIGHGKVTWEKELMNVDERSLVCAIKKKGVLMSRDVSVIASQVFAGFHCVGRVELVPREGE